MMTGGTPMTQETSIPLQHQAAFHLCAASVGAWEPGVPLAAAEEVLEVISQSEGADGENHGAMWCPSSDRSKLVY